MATKNLTFSLLALFFTARLVTAQNVTIFRPSVVHVYVTNALATDLIVHCKSKDDDLGVHSLGPDGTYTFQFRPNLLGGTLFFCSMNWPGNSHHFDIYNEDRDVQKCKLCCWNIKPSGPCRCPCNCKEPCTTDYCYPWE